METFKVLNVLKSARGLIAQGWIQGVPYQTEGALDKATAWCSWGAVHCTVPHDSDLKYKALDVLGLEVVGGNIIPFNDTPGRTQEEVLAVFDDAIRKLEARGGNI